MKTERLFEGIVILVALLFLFSAIGYLLFPAFMLSIVGISSNATTDFLIRTLAAALLALIPSAWSTRKRGNAMLYPSVILGLALYMFLSSIVDLHAFLNNIVNNAAVPSIIFRILLGIVLLWLRPRS